MRRRSKTNSRPHEDLELRQAYRDANPDCEYCSYFRGGDPLPACDIDHILHRRHDVWANMAAADRLCHQEKHRASVDGKIIGMHLKYRKGEFDADVLSRVMGRNVLHWVEMKVESLSVSERFEWCAMELLAGQH